MGGGGGRVDAVCVQTFYVPVFGSEVSVPGERGGGGLRAESCVSVEVSGGGGRRQTAV